MSIIPACGQLSQEDRYWVQGQPSLHFRAYENQTNKPHIQTQVKTTQGRASGDGAETDKGWGLGNDAKKAKTGKRLFQVAAKSGPEILTQEALPLG